MIVKIIGRTVSKVLRILYIILEKDVLHNKSLKKLTHGFVDNKTKQNIVELDNNSTCKVD